MCFWSLGFTISIPSCKQGDPQNSKWNLAHILVIEIGHCPPTISFFPVMECRQEFRSEFIEGMFFELREEFLAAIHDILATLPTKTLYGVWES
jgi:hypothetical protein